MTEILQSVGYLLVSVGIAILLIRLGGYLEKMYLDQIPRRWPSGSLKRRTASAKLSCRFDRNLYNIRSFNQIRGIFSRLN